jgi:hypothetical protein
MLRLPGPSTDLKCPRSSTPAIDGSRLQVMIPPITRRHKAVKLLKYSLKIDPNPLVPEGFSLARRPRNRDRQSQCCEV